MLPHELLIGFLAATAVFAYVPGPAMMYAAGQTLARGRRGGFLAILGLHLGGYAHVLATALGLSAVLRLVPEAYVALKLVGAGYLVWIGLQLMRKAPTPAGPIATPERTGRRALAQSVVVEVLNPKTALFFLAFLPQFVVRDGALPVWLQLLVLGTVVNVMFSSADVLCVLLAGSAMRRLRRAGLGQRVVRALGGSLLVGLGLRLAFERS